MKKITLTLFISLLCLNAVVGQTLDYRQVIFGNNFEQIQEINAEDFLERYPQVKKVQEYSKGQIGESLQNNSKEIKHPIINWVDDYNETPVASPRPKNYFRVYEQKVGEDVFYRVLWSLYALTDASLKKWNENYFEQLLFYKNKNEVFYLGSFTWRSRISTQGGDYPIFETVDIIQKNNKVFGILCSKLELVDYTMMDFQRHSINNKALYYLFDELLAKGSVITEGLKGVNLGYNASEGRISGKALPKCTAEIEASTPLVDSKRPFMYTLQNAFDGNPATSYVENTEDDLFVISIDLSLYLTFSKLAIRNGYGASDSLFSANNRIKSFFYGFDFKNTVTKKMKSLFYEKMTKASAQDVKGLQVISHLDLLSNGLRFSVKEFYHGLKYKDTCLSELDFFTEEIGWLFGGSGE